MQQTSAKRIYDLTWLGGKGDLQGIVQKIKFDYLIKWYMHNQESALDNKIHKIVDFERQTDHLIPTRRPDNWEIINKITKREPSEQWILPPCEPQSKNQRKRRDTNTLTLQKELKIVRRAVKYI